MSRSQEHEVRVENSVNQLIESMRWLFNFVATHARHVLPEFLDAMQAEVDRRRAQLSEDHTREVCDARTRV